jgi:hypothetical protein
LAGFFVVVVEAAGDGWRVGATARSALVAEAAEAGAELFVRDAAIAGKDSSGSLYRRSIRAV